MPEILSDAFELPLPEEVKRAIEEIVQGRDAEEKLLKIGILKAVQERGGTVKLPRHSSGHKGEGEVTIRNLRESELNSARQIFIEVYGEDKHPSASLPLMLEKYRKNPSLYIGCFYGEQMVGVAYGWADGELLVAKAIAVLNAYRHKPLEKALLRRFEKEALKEGYDKFVFGSRLKDAPRFLSYGLECFVNIQVKPDKLPWNSIEQLRSKYTITGVVVFGQSVQQVTVSKLKEKLKVEVISSKSGFESISIQIKSDTVSEKNLEVIERDFNAYATQYCFTNLIAN